MLLAPKSLTAGTTSKICLTVYNQTVDGKAAIRLLDSQKKEIVSVAGKIDQSTYKAYSQVLI